MSKSPKGAKKQAVAQFLAKDPEASPKDIAAKLNKQGLEITPQHVSNIKSELKKQGELGGASAAADVSAVIVAPTGQPSLRTKTNGKINKRQTVRAYLAAHPDAMPTPAAQFLSKRHGVEFKPQLVSTIKSEMAKEGTQAPGGAPRLEQKTSEELVDVSSLLAAKKLVDQLGAEKARQALEVLDRLTS